MHPVMLKALAAEHVRDMRVSAANAERTSEARRARGARRARRAARVTASASAVMVPRPRQSADCH